MAKTGRTVGLIKALGTPSPEAISGAVSDWLDDHPEATTTVEDGAITKAKLDSNLQGTVDDVGELKSHLNSMDGWMADNDFDSDINGKVNVLLTPYTYGVDGFLNNSVILSNGSIRTEGMTSDKGKFVSPLVEVSSGTYGLKVAHSTTIGDINSGSNYSNGYGLYASDGVTAVTKESFTSLGNDIYLLVVPDTVKYVRFCITKGTSDDTNLESAVSYFNQWILLPNANSSIDASFFTLGTKKANGEIDKIRRNDGSYLEIVDYKARADAAEALAMPITFGRRTCAIFKKVCCIGDSFTAGYIMNSSGQATTDPDNSWPAHMAIMTGREYVNCGISGATSKSWLTNENGLAKMQIPANKSQAYLIGLQINDASDEMTVGTVADIGSDADSYVRWISDIIDSVFAVNSAAHVFIQTQPKDFTGIHTPYRAALLAIVDWYQNNGTHQSQVHLIDLLDYYKLYQNPGCKDSMANGHFTAPGWEYCAEILMYAWSNYINAHPLVFQDVNLIPYGTET